MTEGMRRLWEEKFWFICWTLLAIIFQLKFLIIFVILWTWVTMQQESPELPKALGCSMVAGLITGIFF